MATNKERLDANNEEIVVITKTLKDKILSSSVASLKWTLLSDGSYKLEILSK